MTVTCKAFARLQTDPRQGRTRERQARVDSVLTGIKGRKYMEFIRLTTGQGIYAKIVMEVLPRVR